MARLDHKAVIMSLGWTLVLLVLPAMAFKMKSYGYTRDHKGRINMENSFSSSTYSSSSSSSSSSYSGTGGSMWPSSAVSVSSQEEALDDKVSYKSMTVVITLPDSRERDIQVMPMRAGRTHTTPYIKVRAQTDGSRGNKNFEQDFEMNDLPANARLPSIKRSFDDGRLTITTKYKIPRVGLSGHAFDSSAFSSSAFGNTGFDSADQQENDPFNTPFFKNGAFD